MTAEGLAGARQGDRGRLGRRAQREGDLTRRQPVDFAQQERGALRRRQPVQRRLDGVDEFGLLEAVHRARALGVFAGRPWPSPQRAQVVVAGVDGDAVQPGALVQLARLAQTFERLEQHFLGDVARVLAVAHEADGEVVDAERVLAVQIGEGGMQRGVVMTSLPDTELQLHPIPPSRAYL